MSVLQVLCLAELAVVVSLSQLVHSFVQRLFQRRLFNVLFATLFQSLKHFSKILLRHESPRLQWVILVINWLLTAAN